MKQIVFFLFMICFSFSFAQTDSMFIEKMDGSISTETQGTWIGTEIGKSSGTWTLIITGNQVDMNGRGGKEWYKGIADIHPEVTPKTVDVNITQCSAPKYIGSVTLGIYKIVQDTLTMSGNAPGVLTRPTGFVPVGHTRVFVLKKQ